jgi:three-Cys-motif partner protein
LLRSQRRRRGAKADALEEARLFGGWARDKLELLRLYLLAYRRVAGAGGVYLDGFSGSGIVKIQGEEEERLGSAALALKLRMFSRFYLYELDPATMKQLERNIKLRFPQKQWIRVRWREGDFNQRVLTDLEQELIPKAKPTFAFLDPNSTQLDWSTVEALARYKDGPGLYKVEMVILFNTDQALVRLVRREQSSDYATSADARTMDRVMGGRDAWWDLNDKNFSAMRLMGRYVERLRSLGYLDVRAIPILDPATKVRQYFLVHASDHPAAAGLMEWSERAAAPTRKPEQTERLF